LDGSDNNKIRNFHNPTLKLEVNVKVLLTLAFFIAIDPPTPSRRPTVDRSNYPPPSPSEKKKPPSGRAIPGKVNSAEASGTKDTSGSIRGKGSVDQS
jgi:hypothetical protein